MMGALRAFSATSAISSWFSCRYFRWFSRRTRRADNPALRRNALRAESHRIPESRGCLSRNDDRLLSGTAECSQLVAASCRCPVLNHRVS